MAVEMDSMHVYVVDAANQPLMVMEAEQVQRQGLKHRSVFLTLRDKAGRMILRRRPSDHPVYPGRWDIVGSGLVPAGLANEDAAQGCVPSTIAPPEVTHLRGLDATARTGNAFVEIFEAVLDAQESASLVRDRAYLAVDRDELDALARSHPDLLTPALMTVWEERIAVPAS